MAQRQNNDRQLPMVRPSEFGLPDGPMTDVDQFDDALLKATAAGFNVLAPTMRLEFIPPGHQISLRIVQFPAEFSQDQGRAKSNGTWYHIDNGKKLALHGSALAMLAAAAGISIVTNETDLMIRHVWKSTVGAAMKGFDGTPRYAIKGKIVDLRDGSEEAKKAGNGIGNARTHGAALCESKATNRVIRWLLGLKGAYTWDEAAQPFVFPALIFVPDMDDPEIKKMVTAKALGIVAEVFGPDAMAAMAPVVAAPGQVIDADYQLPDQQLTDEMEAAGFQPDGREKQRTGTAPHPDDDPATAQQTIVPEAPPPMGDVCSECGTEVAENVAAYSQRNFQKVLCRPHQPRR